MAEDATEFDEFARKTRLTIVDWLLQLTIWS
jgi:hypothetical protein